MKGFYTLFLVIAIFACFGCAGYFHSRSPKIPQEQSFYRLSSRYFRSGKNGEPNTMEAINNLKPGALEWMYSEDPKVLKLYQKLGLKYSLAINPQVPDSAGYTTKVLRIKDFEGKPYVAPWMSGWKMKNPYWGCVNNPDFYNLFLKQGLKLANLGAYAIMVDDAGFNTRLKQDKLVGCFCEHCVKAFEEYQGANNKKMASGGGAVKEIKASLLSSKKSKKSISSHENGLMDEYAAFQEKSVVDFLTRWKSQIKSKYPNMLFYTNNFGGEWNDIYKVFDGGIAELKEGLLTDKKLDSLYALADRFNKMQVFTLFSENDALQYKLMEYNAKHRRITLLPWDIFIPDKPRYYMDIEKIQRKMAELKIKYNYQ